MEKEVGEFVRFGASGVEKRAGTRLQVSFAWVATLLMLLMIFQVVVGPAKAATEEDAVIIDSVTPLAPENVTDTVPLTDEILSPITGSSSGVDAYPADMASITSTVATAKPNPVFSNENSVISIVTAAGRYSFNTSCPQLMSVSDTDWTELVTESYFTIKSEGEVLTPANGEIVHASAERLAVEYDILTNDALGHPAARMMLEVDFVDSIHPKITASILELYHNLGSWRITWIVLPSSDAGLLLPEMGDKEFSLPLFLNSAVPSENLKIDFKLTSKDDTSEKRLLTIDWSDAGEGVLEVIKHKTSKGVQTCCLSITFGEGREEVDPTIVASSTTDDATNSCFQRKTFSYGGYYWLFYNPDTRICYKRSADGITWSSEYQLPSGYANVTSYGFDVAFRDGRVAVAWLDRDTYAPTYKYLYFENGTVLGSKILWNTRRTITSSLLTIQGPTAAIASDGAFWVSSVLYSGRLSIVYRSYDASIFELKLSTPIMNLANTAYNCILPVSNGDVTLLETVYASTSVRWRYWSALLSAWSSAYTQDLNIDELTKDNVSSALADTSGTIHMTYIDDTTHYLEYARLFRDANTTSGTVLVSAPVYTPTISRDIGGTMHVFYVSSGYVRHMQNTDVLSPWSTPESVIATSSTGTVDSLTSWSEPVNAHALAWTEDDTVDRVMFGSIPLPFGSPGAATEPWSREGLTPYGTYFSNLGELVSPGSGQLTLTQKDVSVTGRNGLGLEISRVYMQPKYLRTTDGRPYMSQIYPQCSMGQGWGLDLPWMNDTYICLPGGHRFVIAWENTGEDDVYENHDGVHFLLKKLHYWDGKQEQYLYELTTASGARYEFDHDTYRLELIGQTQSKDQDVESDDGANVLWVYHDVSGRLTSVEDEDLGRVIGFNYNANGLLCNISRPDGERIIYGYTSLGGRYFLTSVTDTMGRVTTYAYNASADYCLDYIMYPTGGKNSFVYNVDNSMGPDVRSWYVTKDIVKNSTGGIIRQTDILYKVIGGKVSYVKMTDKNETGAVQGYTEHIFDALLNQNTEVKKNSAGTQMSKTVTWSNQAGEPIRVDTYCGNSQTVNYTEYSAYDDWGNRVFSRNALGHESYATFANTNKENSFQGANIMTRTTNGNIFYDTFGDWDYSDWIVDASGGTITLDSTADPPNAPCVKLTKGTTTTAFAIKHTMTAQTTDFVFEAMYKTDGALRSYLQAFAGTSCRVNFSSVSGQFYWYTGSAWTAMTSYKTCSADTWYRVTFYVHPSTNKYDIYIDGNLAYTGATLLLSGNVDRIKFQAGYSGVSTATSIWVDSVKVYKGLTVTTGIPSGYVAELYGSNGAFIARSVSTTLTVPNFKSAFAPGYLKIWKPGWVGSATTVTDIWGGDVYTFSAAYSSASIAKTTTGYKRIGAYLGDDSFSGTSFAYPSNDCTWITDSNLAVSGTKYHESLYKEGTHYHGFNLTSGYMSVTSTDNLIQYVYLSDGKVPAEIMIQYRILSNNTWRRAYWGGTTDMISTATALNPTVKKCVGSMPTTTGKWLQLTVKATDLGITSSTSVTGVVYGLYGGTAKWDYTSRYTNGMTFTGMTVGWTVTMDFGDHLVSNTATSTSVTLDPYASYVRVFPASATVRITNGETLIYESPELYEIYASDAYSYSVTTFYPNDLKDLLHATQVGKFEYQNAAKTVTQDAYMKCDSDGNVVETKTRSASSSWVYTQAAYDYYGNLLWAADGTGRKSFVEYSDDDLWTYPAATRTSGNTDYFEFDTSWTAWKGASGSPTWLNSGYVTTQSYSPGKSVEASFTSGTSGYDTGIAGMWKEYNVRRVSGISVAMYLDTYSHNNRTGELMDSGIKMRLYNSAGTNYANYTYWLSCWSYQSSNRTTTDPNIKVVYGVIPRYTWKEVRLYPELDWAISWDACTKVKFELYTYATYAYEDYFKVYFDDFTIDSTTEYVYDLDTGLSICLVDAMGGMTNYTYDDLGRALSITYPKVGATRSDTTNVYDDTNNKVTVYDELDHKTVSYYDSIGRMTKAERYNGTTLYSIQLLGYNWQDQQSYQTDAMGRTTKTNYDYLGRAVKVTNPDNTYSTMTYDDYRLTVTYCSYTATNTLTHKTANVYDYLGRHNSTREYTSSTVYKTTWMAYDEAGNMLTVKDARNQISRMTYDYLDRQVSVTYPDNYTETSTYDAAGRESTFRSRAGVIATYYYDSTGRPTRAVTTGGDTTHAMYDALGRGLQKQNLNAKTTYAYDARGSMLSQSQYMISGGSTYNLTYSYNPEGEPLSITYPDGTLVVYTYDNMDRAYLVERQVGPTKYRIVNYTYNLDDSVRFETTGSGHQTYCQYNSRGWPSSIVTKLSGSTILSLTYTYDDVGNVKTIGSESYNYDWLDRMISATGAWGTISFTYDNVGNRLTQAYAGMAFPTTYTYSWYNKLASEATGTMIWSYVYDKDGNNFWKNATASRWNYVFNKNDQLSSVVQWTYSSTWTSSTVGTYYYDGNSARVRTVEGSTTTDYVYSSHDQLYEKSGSVNIDYVYSGTRLVAKLRSYTGGAYHNYYLDDALGSTRFVYNGTTQTYAVQTYKPFGIPYGESGSDKVKFAGEMQDASTGLYYLYTRYYEAGTGRFLSLDSEHGSPSSPQTMNRYVYCLNDPLRYVDPTGQTCLMALYGLVVWGAISGIFDYLSEWTESGEDFSTSKMQDHIIVGMMAGFTAAQVALTAIGCLDPLLAPYIIPAAALISTMTYVAYDGIVDYLNGDPSPSGEDLSLGYIANLIIEVLCALLPIPVGAIDVPVDAAVEYSYDALMAWWNDNALPVLWECLLGLGDPITGWDKSAAYENLIRNSDLYNLYGDGPIIPFEDLPSAVPMGGWSCGPRMFPI